jgi:hypothetical protein
MLKFYGDAYDDIGYSIAQNEDGWVITGQINELLRAEDNYISGSSKKMSIIKTGANGNVIWQKSFGDLQTATGSRVLTLDDGSVVSAGSVTDSLTLKKNIYIVKINSEGTTFVEKIYKNPGNQYAIDILKTTEGFLVLGSTDVERQPLTDSTGNASGKKDILLMRINDNLETIVIPTAHGFPGDDTGAALKQDLSGGYVIVGSTDRSERSVTTQAGNNILILRVNDDVDVTHSRILGGVANEYVSDIEVLNDGYLIAGTTGNEGGQQYGHVWKISGNIYSEPLIDRQVDIDPALSFKPSFTINAISRYKTNSFVMAGQSGSGSSAKMLIFVTDGDGNFIAGKKKIAGGTTGTQVAYDVISDGDNNIIAVGKTSYENNSMISLLKFRF